MADSLSKLKQWRYFIFSAAALGAVLYQGPFFARDTHDYLADTIIRSPLTPLLLSLLRLLVGAGYAWAFIALQTTAVLAAAAFFARALSRAAKAGPLPEFIFFMLALSPLFTDWIGNWLLSEGISYALLLASAGLLLQLQETFGAGKMCLLAGAMSVNLLNRPQMLFVYPLYAVCAALLICRQFKILGRTRWLAHAAFWALLPFAAAGLLGRSWNLARHGSFTMSDFPGRVQLASSLLYVSDSADLALFKAKPYYPAMQRIYAEMDELKLSAKYRHELDMNYAAYLDSAVKPRGIYNNFSSRSDVLYFHVLARELYCFASGEQISRDEWKETQKIDYGNTRAWLSARETADDISRTLAPARWLEYLKLVGSKFRNRVSFGEALLLLTLALLPFAWPGPAQNFMAASACAAGLNLLLTASCTSLLRRLTFYSDTLLLLSAALLLWLLFQSRRAAVGNGGA